MIHTDYYELGFNKSKNRIYWKIKGFWPSLAVVPYLHYNWKNVLAKARPQFTIITDLREMKAQPEPVKKLHEDIRMGILNAGVLKMATVVASPLTRWSVESITNESGMRVYLQNFNTVADAENWLDR